MYGDSLDHLTFGLLFSTVRMTSKDELLQKIWQAVTWGIIR